MEHQTLKKKKKVESGPGGRRDSWTHALGEVGCEAGKLATAGGN